MYFEAALIFVLCFSQLAAQGFYKNYFLDISCDQDIYVGDGLHDSALILRATSVKFYYFHKECNVTLRPAAGSGLVVAVKEVDLNTSSSGEKDRLYLKVGNTDPQTWAGKQKDFGEREAYVSGLTPPDNTVLVSMRQETSNSRHTGFEMVITSYKGYESNCSADYFNCDYLRCVRQVLVCDKHNNCGNRRDEKDCGINSGALIAIVFLSVIALVAIIVLAIVCVRKKQYLATTRRHHSIISPPTESEATVVSSNYQTSYGTPSFNYKSPYSPVEHNSEAGTGQPTQPTPTPPPPQPRFDRTSNSPSRLI